MDLSARMITTRPANRAKADGSMDLESRLTEYISKEKNKAIEDLAEDEGLSVEAIQNSSMSMITCSEKSKSYKMLFCRRRLV